ncbi:septation protein A [Stakelama sediminis]|uniref:Inner membrane-spanning protein YciB n=1 Tax=Stakelama sediminis TaxID=463200 RepID=A0A840YUW0_9SPHN|nr:septation protein A [Stakelama sediminis]MBB5717360.1 intracellular septation protein [Stakelama sediminis]
MADEKTPLSPGMRMAIDFGPLAVFFLAYFLSKYLPIPDMVQGLGQFLVATVAFIVATVIAMAASLIKVRHISPMLWISGGLVIVFGGLTLYFHDETFIKMKPTIVYLIFAIVLGYGLVSGRPVLQSLLETAYPGLNQTGWRKLTINWTIFFIGMAVLNECVWRTQSTDFWVAFKLWGAVPLTMIFAAANIPMLLRHGLTTEGEKDPPIPPEG